jgi:hypothetical protein
MSYVAIQNSSRGAPIPVLPEQGLIDVVVRVGALIRRMPRITEYQGAKMKDMLTTRRAELANLAYAELLGYATTHGQDDGWAGQALLALVRSEA